MEGAPVDVKGVAQHVQEPVQVDVKDVQQPVQELVQVDVKDVPPPAPVDVATMLVKELVKTN